jgi:hypothetical protein
VTIPRTNPRQPSGCQLPGGSRASPRAGTTSGRIVLCLARGSPRPIPLRRRRSVPIANADRLVLPDTLGTTIKLSSSASRRCLLAWRQRTTASGGRCCHLCIGPTVVTCLEILWPAGFWHSGPALSRFSQPGAIRSITECEHGRRVSALAGTPIRRAWILSSRANSSYTDHRVMCTRLLA